MKSKKLPKYVTYTMLAQFAKAADQTFAVKLAAMEERLRDEFAGPFYALDLPPYQDVNPSQAEAGTYEGNHLAPTTHEGDE